MTVSRALSNHPNVREDTRRAVLERAREMGYVKSAAARTMRGDGTKIVGLLLPNIVNEFYARFADTLAKACERESYHLMIHLTNDDAAAERVAMDRMQEVQAEAVVMVPAPSDAAGQDQHPRPMKVIQLIRQRPAIYPVSSILVEDAGAIRDAVLHLAGQGHSRIGYIGADANLSSGRSRLLAFREGLRAAGLTEISDLVFTEAPSYEMGQRCAARILEQGRATVIVCGGVEISNGALSVFLGHSREQAPVTFVGYGDPAFYAWVDEGISTVRVPVDSLAHQAMQMIMSDGTGEQQAVHAAELIIRNSGRHTAAAPASSG